MKLLGSTKKDVDNDKNGEIVPKLESVEVVLVHCSLMMMNTVNTEFSFIEVWFTGQASKALGIEDNVNLTLIIGSHYKNEIFNRTNI